MARRVLVSGADGALGALVVGRLAVREGLTVVGVSLGSDVDGGGSEGGGRVAARPRAPALTALLEGRGIDTVVHLPTGGGLDRGDGAAIVDTHVLAACEQSPGVGHIVLGSSAAVYGAGPDVAGVADEESVPVALGDRGPGARARCIEDELQRVRAARDDLATTVLRFAAFLEAGGDVDRWLSLPAVPTVLGFDPRMQFCHLEDAAAAVERAVVDARSGVYNVAGEGTLYLSQCLRLARRPGVPIPGPLVDATARLLRRTRGVELPPGPQLRFGRVMDTTRLREVLGVSPRHDARAVLVDHLERRDGGEA